VKYDTDNLMIRKHSYVPEYFQCEVTTCVIFIDQFNQQRGNSDL